MISSKRFLVMKGCQEISKKYFLLGKYFSESCTMNRKTAQTIDAVRKIVRPLNLNQLRMAISA